MKHDKKQCPMCHQLVALTPNGFKLHYKRHHSQSEYIGDATKGIKDTITQKSL